MLTFNFFLGGDNLNLSVWDSGNNRIDDGLCVSITFPLACK